MVDYDWNTRKQEGENYYLPRILTKEDLGTSRVRNAFNNPQNPLILIKNHGNPRYAKTPEQKISLIQSRGQFDTILFVWMGKFSSDTFHLSSTLCNLALEVLGYEAPEKKLKKLGSEVTRLEALYQHSYRNTQRWQNYLKDTEEALLNAKEERDMLNSYLNPKHPHEARWDREYKASQKGYAEPVADDNNYWADDNDYWH